MDGLHPQNIQNRKDASKKCRPFKFHDSQKLNCSNRNQFFDCTCSLLSNLAKNLNITKKLQKITNELDN